MISHTITPYLFNRYRIFEFLITNQFTTNSPFADNIGKANISRYCPFKSNILKGFWFSLNSGFLLLNAGSVMKHKNGVARTGSGHICTVRIYKPCGVVKTAVRSYSFTYCLYVYRTLTFTVVLKRLADSEGTALEHYSSNIVRVKSWDLKIYVCVWCYWFAIL